MQTRIQKHIRSNVVGYVAVFIALAGGTAIAAQKAPKNSVVSKSIRDGQVKSADLRDGGVRGRDVDEASLGQVRSALAAERAADAERLGGSDPAQFQRRVPAGCTGSEAISRVKSDGSVDCASAVIPFANQVSGVEERLLFPSDLSLVFLCGAGGTTEVQFKNRSGGTATLNWIFSEGGIASTVNASGDVMGDLGKLAFDYADARLEGHFVYATAHEVTSVNLHAFDGSSSCEVRGTAQYAAKG